MRTTDGVQTPKGRVFQGDSGDFHVGAVDQSYEVGPLGWKQQEMEEKSVPPPSVVAVNDTLTSQDKT
jgi:hypothetical protein